MTKVNTDFPTAVFRGCKNTVCGLVEAGVEAFDRQTKSLIKLAGYAAGWTAIQLGNDDPRAELAGRVSEFMGNAKNLLSAFSIPGQVSNLWKGERDTQAEGIIQPLCQFVKPLVNFTRLVNSTSDAFDLYTKFCPVAPAIKEKVKWYNSVATLTGSSCETVRSVHLAYERGVFTREGFGSCLSAATAVSYVGLAVTSLFYKDQAKPWHYLAWVTSGTVFGMLQSFYSKLSPQINSDWKEIKKAWNFSKPSGT